MASTPRFRNKQPTDVWSIRERLCLASSVLRSGDQNWVSVSRAIRPFGETNRPPDWFSQKNCALQYSELLEKVETPNRRKRGERGDTIDTPGDMIVRRLTQDRIEELKKVIHDSQQRHKKFKRELEMVRCGQLDEKLDDLWRGIQDEIRAKEIADHEHSKWVQEREIRNAQATRLAPKGMIQTSPGKSKRQRHIIEMRRNSPEPSEQDSALNEQLSVEVEELSSPNVVGILGSTHGGELVTGLPATSTSPLLTSLLKSPSQTTAPTQQTSRGLNPAAGEIPSPTAGLSGSRLGTFFNPSSALAAARQFAVACTDAGGLFPPSADPSTVMSSPGKLDRNAFTSSVTSSAPTLSRLLELPPSMPGKLPPLPIVEPSPPPPLPPPPPPSAPMTVPMAVPGPGTHLHIQSHTSQAEQVLATDEHGNVSIIEGEDPDILSGVEGEDDSELTRLVQLDQDMDMEAIVNEIMKEDLNVEDNDDSQMTLNTPPSAPSHILEEISQEELEMPSQPAKTEEQQQLPQQSQGFTEDPSAPSEVQVQTSMGEKTQVPEEEISQQPLHTSSATLGPAHGMSEDCPPTQVQEPVPVSMLPESQKSSEMAPIVSEDLSTTQDSQDTMIAKEQKGILTPTKTVDFGRSLQSGGRKSSPMEMAQEQEEQSEAAEVEEDEEDAEEESTNPSQEEEESSSLPDDETKEGQVGSEDSREAEEEGLSSEMFVPPAEEEEKDQPLEEESMGSVDSKIPKAPSSISDSIPNSPVSTPQSDDQESLRDYKVWKKAIMLVWRAAANHKYANVFLHPVTNDMAPGYHSIVYRPMDLSTIKKNIESGAIKTTLEFQRDLMLMFQNAIMYNSSDHDVFQMAVLMQKEVMEVVQDFVATQLMVQTTETKVLRGREPRAKDGSVLPSPQQLRTETETKEEELKRKRSSFSDSETKLKKRRPKQDE